MTAPPPDDKQPPHPLANLTPEQMRALLASDLKKSAPRPTPAQARESSRRRLVWAGLILAAALFYVVFRVGTTPAKVILINASGEDAASVVLISGTQRIDLGAVANGEAQKAEVLPGNPLEIEYRFDARRLWRDAEPLRPFQSLTVFLSTGHRVQAVRETPWSRSTTAQTARPASSSR